jgi:hypothetical protein
MNPVPAGPRPAPSADPAGAVRPVLAFIRAGRKAGVLAGGMLVLIVLLAGALDGRGAGWLRIVALVALLGGVAVLWRLARLAICARPGQLVIRNFRTTYRIPWAQIEDIYQQGPTPEGYLSNPLQSRRKRLLVRLTDGTVISATLYSSALFVFSDDGRQVIETLNNLRRQRA